MNINEMTEMVIEETAKAVSQYDSVNNPSHYTQGRKIQPIDVIEDWNLGFSAGNALKYISRAGRKAADQVSQTDAEKQIEDIEKAIWYLERRVKELKENLCD